MFPDKLILKGQKLAKNAEKEKFSQYLKITQNVTFELLDFGTFHQFCPIKSDLSGNTV